MGKKNRKSTRKLFFFFLKKFIIFLVWIPSITLSGHFGEVMDITWGTDFNYILSVRFFFHKSQKFDCIY